MEAVVRAIVLGIVQGLTEFIPVSSSGHLVIVPKLLGWHDPGLAFDVAVHLGTLLAVLAYFWRDWLAVIAGFFTSLKTKPRAWSHDQRLAWLIIMATVPAALAGLLLSDFFDTHLRSPGSAATFLLAGSLIMFIAEVLSRRKRDFGSLRARDAGAMGLAQVIALAPGMSRSGITMSTGMFSGLKRDAAAKFSFMMAAPVIGGAGLVEAAKVAKHGTGGVGGGAMAAGFTAAAVVGFLAVKFLLAYLRRGTLMPFVIYGLCVATALLLLIALN